MLFDKLLYTALVAATAVASPVEKRQFDYGNTKVRGVNIGGWLLLEPFITPSIFQNVPDTVVDEYTLTQQVGNAADILQAHWSSWATQGDFAKLAGAGFNLFRIPVGYWAYVDFEGDPYVQGADYWLEQAIGWARGLGVKVWIDLHGAPRSQNGFDNSGQRTDSPQWTADQASTDATVQAIRAISQKYATGAYSDVVVGIELLNEPLMSNLPGGRDATQQYYQNSFNAVRESGQTMVIFHDGFVNPSAWNGFLTGSGTDGAIVDHHEYQVFTAADNALSPQEHVDQVYARIQSWGTGFDKFTICGEWSAALTDCAFWLNGKGRGARYDGTFGGYGGSQYVGTCEGRSGAISTWSEEWKQATANYINAQRSAFEEYLQGWIVWNFKTEGAGDWSVVDLIDNGIWQ